MHKLLLIDGKRNVHVLYVDWTKQSCAVIDHLMRFNELLAHCIDASLMHVVLDSDAWKRVIENETVIAWSGDQTTILHLCDYTELMHSLGIKPTISVTLRAIPFLTFHVVD